MTKIQRIHSNSFLLAILLNLALKPFIPFFLFFCFFFSRSSLFLLRLFPFLLAFSPSSSLQNQGFSGFSSGKHRLLHSHVGNCILNNESKFKSRAKHGQLHGHVREEHGRAVLKHEHVLNILAQHDFVRLNTGM